MTKDLLLQAAYGKLGWLKVVNGAVVPNYIKVEQLIAETFIPDVMLQFNENVPFRRIWALQFSEGQNSYALPDDCESLLEVFQTPRTELLVNDPFYLSLNNQIANSRYGAADIVDTALSDSFVWKGIQNYLDPGVDYELIEGKLFVFEKIQHAQIFVVYRKRNGWTLDSLPETFIPYLEDGLASRVASYYIRGRESVSTAMKTFGQGAPSVSREGVNVSIVETLEKSFQQGLDLLNKRQSLGVKIV